MFLKISLIQWKDFFTYFSIKFDNLYLKWNFLRIWLLKWKNWILFYETSPSKIILIENTKLFFFFLGCGYIYNLSNKKCIYIIKKCTYVYIYVRGSCLDKYISIALDLPKQKFLASPLFPSLKELSFKSPLSHCFFSFLFLNLFFIL